MKNSYIHFTIHLSRYFYSGRKIDENELLVIESCVLPLFHEGIMGSLVYKWTIDKFFMCILSEFLKSKYFFTGCGY